MKAIVVVEGAQGATLALRAMPDPVPGPGELLVRIRAAGLNRTDLRRAQQHYSSNAGRAHIAGLEMAGEVVAVGAEVTGFAPGDRVMSQANGCYAEQVCVDHRLVLRVPQGLAWDAAAAVPVTFVTAHDALVTHGGLAAGRSVLVHAATSGVGLSAIQIARLMQASTVIGTTRDAQPAKVSALRALGLDLAVDTASNASFATRVLAATAERGVDIVADTIGAGALADNLRCTALGGRIISIGRLGGMTDTIDLDLLSLRRISLVGVTFRTRSLQEKRAVNERFLADMASHLASGRLAPVVDRRYPLDEALQAQEYMRANHHMGKIVLLT